MQFIKRCNFCPVFLNRVMDLNRLPMGRREYFYMGITELHIWLNLMGISTFSVFSMARWILGVIWSANVEKY